ncbi:MAG: Lrp/AsnC family transcriptional regulator [Nocardioides sp.]|uniref:Lrp/AsnC family transcriptional regulator n=1 Tax=Nocardioides sp. TaxID=35761 RepID=UPI003D6A3869
MSNQIAPGVLDSTDEAIISLLEEDGRLTHREIAAQIDLSRSAAATRVQRLLSEGHIDVRGVVHPAVLGHDVLAHVSVSVNGSATRVAHAAAARDDTTLVSMTSGHHALVLEIRAGDIVQIDDALAEVRAIEGIVSTETLLYTEVLRDVAAPVGRAPAAGSLDETDYALLRALQSNGRASYVDLAASVGLSPAGARRRVVGLLAGNVVRVGAVVRHSGHERRTATGIGLRLDGSAHRPITEQIAQWASVTFAARTLGRYDALLTVATATSGDLVEVLDHIRDLDGVRETETWSHLRFVKETYASLHLGVD